MNETQEQDAQKVLEEASSRGPKEELSSQRKLTGFWRAVCFTVAIGWTLFQMYTAATLGFDMMVQGGVFLGCALVLVFLIIPGTKHDPMTHPPWWDVILALLAIPVVGRLIITGGFIPAEVQAFMSWNDRILALLCVLLSLEATRRTMGMAIVIVAVALIVYAFIGPWMPSDVLRHPGATLDSVLSDLYFSDTGMFGVALRTTTQVVFIIVSLGAFLLAMGGGEAFIKVAVSLVGRFRGGPAKVGVIGSALFGTISGSSVANVVGVGVFTIPLMKRLGYRSEFAGGVEAASSCGGQIMPPVLGAAAFVMAELLGMPYKQLMLACLIPAVLYFGAVFIMVDLEAVKGGLKGVAKEEIPRLREVLKRTWYLFGGLVIFIFLLVAFEWSPTRAAFFAIVTVVATNLIEQLIRTRRYDIKPVYKSLESSAMGMLGLGAGVAAIGITICEIDATGVGVKFSSMLTQLAGGNLLILAIMTALASIVLGMGVPTLVCYLLLAVLSAPALIQLGVHPLAAHMFVFYFGIMANITPPVAIASYAAAMIAKAPPVSTAWQACRLGLTAYIVPFMFIFGPALLLVGQPVDIVIAVVSAMIGVVFLSMALQGQAYVIGKVNLVERAVLGVGSLLLIYVGWETSLVGLLLVTAVYVVKLARSRLLKTGLAKNP